MAIFENGNGKTNWTAVSSILIVFSYLIGSIWWASNISANVTSLNEFKTQREKTPQRLVELAGEIQTIKQQLKNIECNIGKLDGKIDKIIFNKFEDHNKG